MRLPSYNFSVPYAVICDCRNLAVRSGQPSFSSGSHVSSASEDPLHFRRYSTLPFPPVFWEIFTPRILPHPVASSTFFSFCFFLSAHQLSGLKGDAAQSSAQVHERKQCHTNSVSDRWGKWPPGKEQISSHFKTCFVLTIETKVNIALWLRVWS